MKGAASRLDAVDAGVDLASHTSFVQSSAIGTGFGVAESSTLQSSASPTADRAVGLD